MGYRKESDIDLIDRSTLKPDLGDAEVGDGSQLIHYSKGNIQGAPSVVARPKTYLDAPHDTLLGYIWEMESSYYIGEHSDQGIEKILTTMYALYKAAWAIGEITWDNMFYSYADFVAKFLKIR